MKAPLRKYHRFFECVELYEKNKKHYPKVAKCDKSDNIIKIYNNTLRATEDTPGSHAGNIWRACKGIYASHKGFKWRFINE